MFHLQPEGCGKEDDQVSRAVDLSALLFVGVE